MKRLQWNRYKALELIPDLPPLTPIPQPDPTPSSWLKAVWQMFDIVFLRDLQPRVWQTTDPETGKPQWHLYHPETGKTSHLKSEAEIRQWLEQVLRY